MFAVVVAHHAAHGTPPPHGILLPRRAANNIVGDARVGVRLARDFGLG